MLICITGARAWILKLIPKQVLLAGERRERGQRCVAPRSPPPPPCALPRSPTPHPRPHPHAPAPHPPARPGCCGIGVFIAFVGFKDAGFITQAPYPTLLRLNLEDQYHPGPVIDLTFHGNNETGPTPSWNSCVMWFGGGE